MPQCLQKVASALIISAQCGHFLVMPNASKEGSNNMATTSKGNNAHSINHKT